MSPSPCAKRQSIGHRATTPARRLRLRQSSAAAASRRARPSGRRRQCCSRPRQSPRTRPASRPARASDRLLSPMKDVSGTGVSEAATPSPTPNEGSRRAAAAPSATASPLATSSHRIRLPRRTRAAECVPSSSGTRLAAPPNAAHRSRSTASVPWQRSAGSFRRQISTNATSAGGVEGATAASRGGSWWSTAVDGRGERLGEERRSTTQHLVDDASEAEDVRARINPPARRLLGAHVGRGTYNGTTSRFVS